ncbi:MAG: TetR/AcrR family transcriptional regulator [Nannocystaceae bacterium]|nr:TetR/AcrR family transcriptional regulator [Nannocystaceae bacterium]
MPVARPAKPAKTTARPNKARAARRAAAPATTARRRSPPKRRGEGADRRAEILAATRRLLLAEGPEGVSMRKVAAAVGVSSTAVYLYFREKDELLDAICYDVFDRIVPALESLMAAPGDPLDRLRLGLQLYLRFGLQHPDEYRAVFLTRRPNNGWDHLAPLHHVDRWGNPRVNTFMFLVEGLRRCVEAGRIRDGDLTLMAEVVLGAQHGLLALLLNAPEQKWSDTDALVEANVELILRGLAP